GRTRRSVHVGVFGGRSGDLAGGHRKRVPAGLGVVDPTARRFVLASVAWLAAGTLLGLAMAWPGAYPVPVQGGRPLPAHAHIQVFGFVTMMIFGVALHILPRFQGRPLPSRLVAEAQWAAANAGLLLFAAGHLFAAERWI